MKAYLKCCACTLLKFKFFSKKILQILFLLFPVEYIPLQKVSLSKDSIFKILFSLMKTLMIYPISWYQILFKILSSLIFLILARTKKNPITNQCSKVLVGNNMKIIIIRNISKGNTFFYNSITATLRNIFRFEFKQFQILIVCIFGIIIYLFHNPWVSVIL